MAKVDLTQTIKDFKGNPYYENVSNETSQVVQQMMVVLESVTDKQTIDKFVKKMNSDLGIGKAKTLQDIAISALMVETDEGKRLETYKLLSIVGQNEKPDLGETERKTIFNKIKKVYQNVLIVGRAEEMLVAEYNSKHE